MKSAIYQPRSYRDQFADSQYEQFIVQHRESDLWIRAQVDLSALASEKLIQVRNELELYIDRHPEFACSLAPVSVGDDAPDIVLWMAQAASKTGVGPMAGVAGAINYSLFCELKKHSPMLIIENGGDIIASGLEPVVVAIYAGGSPLSMRIGVKVGVIGGIGVCTSSGTVGHSLSFGKADAVTVISRDCILADAAATAIGNRIKTHNDFDRAIRFAQTIDQIIGVVIIMGERIGAWGGDFEITGI